MSKYIDNRKNTSRKLPELDQLYVYQTRHKIKFTHRHQKAAGYPYTVTGIRLTSAENEIHIYHRTAEIRGVSMGLTLVTKDGRYREVQRWFKEQVIYIAEDDYLFEIFSHAKPSPTKLGIGYTY